MRRILRSMVALVAISLAGCIWVPVDNVDPGFDFNGVWSFALTNVECQGQIANIEIFQSGSGFSMTSGSLRWDGSCDPYQGTFSAEESGSWGYWIISGGVTSSDNLAGTYSYVEDRTGECAGTFVATRIAYRALDAPAGPVIKRLR